jgi:LPS sulfotransferase NodH
MPGYAICTEPRSGSNYLSRLLRSTGMLGRPTEYFNPMAVREVLGAVDFPDDPEAQLARLPELASTPNGVYGLKLFSSDFDRIKSTRWAARLPGLAFVYLERQDLLGQAISLVRADQTKQWVSRREAQGDPVYDRVVINDTLVSLVRASTRWRFYFARNGLPVLNLVYENVVQSPESAVEAVGRLVGLAEPPKIDWDEAKGLDVQRDAINEEWRGRFVSESRDLTAFF